MKNAAAESFVPFEPRSEPAPAAEPGPRLKVVPNPEGKPDFAPLQASPTLNLHEAHASAAGAGPFVTLQKEGDRVTGIRIECSCGQVIELACSY